MDGQGTPKKMHLKGANSKCNNSVPLMKIIVERRNKATWQHEEYLKQQDVDVMLHCQIIWCGPQM
jgi:hypothetical protein